jgi:hypothetical protein
MDSIRDFSCEICKTHYLMSQSLDDIHASLPDLKYRPPFDEDLLSLIWVIFIVWLLAHSSWPI